MTAGAPRWLRVTGAMIRGLPRGRYAAVSALRPRPARFVASLAPALGGARFECDCGDDIAREACLTGWYEPPQTRIALAWLRPGARVVDAGANWGYFTLVAAAIAGRTGAIVALEPDARHAAVLERNVRLNGFAWVQVRAVAAAAERGHAELVRYADGDHNRGTSHVAEGRGSRSEARGSSDPLCLVELAPIDAVAPAGRVDLVKIDVEGAEDDVLRGMAAGLASCRYRAILLEPHPQALRARGLTMSTCERRLADAGYHGWAIDTSPRAYRRASAARRDWRELLLPLAASAHAIWPHQFWIAPGETAV